MRVIDPGHQYALRQLDGDCEEILTFVKRQGEGYPGNVGEYPGTNIQEVLRALIDRLNYLHRQIPHDGNTLIVEDLRDALWTLEARAANRHNRPIPEEMRSCGSVNRRIELLPTCPKCGHIGCWCAGPSKGCLEIGSTSTGQVVINHAELDRDKQRPQVSRGACSNSISSA